MYKENDFVYILYVRCNLDDAFFYVNVACLGPPERVHKIKQYLKCYLGDTKNSDKLFLETQKRHCSLLQNNSECFNLPIPMNTNLIKISFFLDNSVVNFSNCLIANDSIIATTISGSPEYDSMEYGGLCNKYYILYLSNAYKYKYIYSLSSCRTEFQTKFRPKVCGFCENIYPISVNCEYKYCHAAQYYICYKCYSYIFKGDPKYCIEAKVYLEDVMNVVHFYCRWYCGNHFNNKDIKCHEDICKTNVQQALTKIVAKQANNYFTSRLNVFTFEEYSFMKNEIVCVITYDYVKFVLHSSYENNVHRFWVSHNYSEGKYLVQFKIMDKTYKTPHFLNNELVIPFNEVSNILGFAVLLKKC